MANPMTELYEVVSDRKVNPQKDSYTCYLFEKGIDKILKKIGEEASETIIAAKNKDNQELTMEICDLLYHLTVLMVNEGVKLEDVEEELTKRSAKIGNLKTFHVSDHNT